MNVVVIKNFLFANMTHDIKKIFDEKLWIVQRPSNKIEKQKNIYD
jgi:hypothetical protein